MICYLTLHFRDPVEPLIKSFDSRSEAIRWLELVGIPKYGYQIAHIHVDET